MGGLKVVSIEKQKEENGRNVELRLNEALEHIKNNPASNCALILTMADGSVMDSWANDSDTFVMVGALESLKRDFMESNIERTDRG